MSYNIEFWELEWRKQTRETIIVKFQLNGTEFCTAIGVVEAMSE